MNSAEQPPTALKQGVEQAESCVCVEELGVQ